MNCFSCPGTYEIGFGIRHLYTTRDYFESREDYWRVPKKETKAIYRIHLDEKWANMFVLKHKTETEPWPYARDDAEPDDEWYLEKTFALEEETGEWKIIGYTLVIKSKHRTLYIPVDENGNRIKKE